MILRFFLFCALCLPICISCTDPASSGAEGASGSRQLTGYQVEPVSGAAQQRALRRSADGKIVEEGFLLDGKRTGTWVSYHPGTVIPKNVVSFVDDQYNGIYLEFNNRGQLELRASYTNNKLDGPWAKYRFGRPTHEAYYKDGKLDGIYREYVMNTGKLQKEMTYRDGKLHGPFRFYNDQGEVTAEFEYRNGEKTGGGITNPNKPNEPK